MAIRVQHTYSTHVEVTFDRHFHYWTNGTMDEIFERICDELVIHNFNHANVCSSETGEILMIVERS